MKVSKSLCLFRSNLFLPKSFMCSQFKLKLLEVGPHWHYLMKDQVIKTQVKILLLRTSNLLKLLLMLRILLKPLKKTAQMILIVKVKMKMRALMVLHQTYLRGKRKQSNGKNHLLCSLKKRKRNNYLLIL